MRAFKDPTSLRSAYDTAKSHLSGPFRQMALVEGLVSGKAPYSDEELRSRGFGDISNQNFRDAKVRLRRQTNRVKGMIAAPRPVASVTLPGMELSRKTINETTVANALSETILTLPKLYNLRNSRIRDMVKFGAGLLVFPDSLSVFPEYIPRGSFALPADSPADPAEWDCIYFRSTKPLIRLYEIQANEELAKAQGWNMEEIRATLVRWKHENKGENLTMEQAYSKERWLAFEEAAAVGLFDGAFESYRLPVVEAYTVNKDGKIDRYMAIDGVEARADQFLLKKTDVAESMESVMFPLYYSEDSEFFWSVEGYGNDIYAAESTALRLQNTAVDLSDIAMRPVIKSATKNSSALARVGRFIQVDSSDEINVDMMGAKPEMAVVMTSLLGNKADALADNQSPGSDERGSKQPLSAEEMKMRIGDSSEQEAAMADLVYRQEEVLIQEICKRAIALRTDSIAKDLEPALEKLRSQLAEQLIGSFPKKFEFSIVRGIGHGSDQDRQRRLRVGYDNRGALDPLGRSNMIEDFFRELFGARVARYVSPIDPRKQVVKESHDMRQENLFFSLGKSPQPALDDNHVMHSYGHVQFLSDIMQQVMQAEQNGQQVNMAPVATTFEMALPHVAFHIDQMGAAATTEDLQQEFKQMLSVIAQLTNFGQKAKQNAQKQAEAEQMRQQQAMQQQQQFMQQMAATIDTQNLRIQKLSSDYTIARDKMEAAQDVRERESQAKIDRQNRESEAKIAATPLSLNGDD